MTRYFDTTIGQREQFDRLLAQAGFTLEDVKHILAKPALAGKMRAALQAELVQGQRFYPARSYSRYDTRLHGLQAQLWLLRELNQKMPRKLRIPESWLDLDTTSTHVQGVEDLEFWYVELDSLEATWAFNQKLIELTQPAIYVGPFARDTRSMRRHVTAHRYEPGIHQVRINLVDNWDPEKGRTIDQVHGRAVVASKELAAVEAIGAYALQAPGLYKSQDGENLPYFDCAGLEQGVGFAQVPCSSWDRFDRQVCFLAGRPDHIYKRYSAPSLVA